MEKHQQSSEDMAKVRSPDGRANGKEGERSWTTCISEYNQWWQETYGVRE